MNQNINLLKAISNEIGRHYYEIAGSLEANSPLTERETFYLDVIFRSEKLRLSEFAEAVGVSRPAATQIVQRFLTKDYLVKEVSDSDKRVVYISLSEKMQAYFNQTDKILNQVFEEIFHTLTEEENQQMGSFLDRILEKLYDRTN